MKKVIYHIDLENVGYRTDFLKPEHINSNTIVNVYFHKDDIDTYNKLTSVIRSISKDIVLNPIVTEKNKRKNLCDDLLVGHCGGQKQKYQSHINIIVSDDVTLVNRFKSIFKDGLHIGKLESKLNSNIFQLEILDITKDYIKCGISELPGIVDTILIPIEEYNKGLNNCSSSIFKKFIQAIQKILQSDKIAKIVNFENNILTLNILNKNVYIYIKDNTYSVLYSELNVNIININDIINKIWSNLPKNVVYIHKHNNQFIFDTEHLDKLSLRLNKNLDICFFINIANETLNVVKSGNEYIVYPITESGCQLLNIII